MTQKKGNDNAKKDNHMAGIGLGLTAAAVAAAGAYFLYGSKQASQNRKKVKGWMLKAKGEVLEALEKAEAITEEEYKALVETASGAYGTVKNATAGEVRDFKKEMHEHWVKLQKNKAVKKIAHAAAAHAKGKVIAAQKKSAPKKAAAKSAPKKAAK